MSACRKAIKHLAQCGIDDFPVANKNVKRDVQLLFPFISGNSVRVDHYFGDVGISHFDRSLATLDYNLQQYKEDTNKYKKLRKTLRNRLVTHVDSNWFQGCKNVSLVMDLCYNVLEFFDCDAGNSVFDIQDIKEVEAFAAEPTKRFYVRSTQLQCASNECHLLRVLNRCNAIVKKVKTLESVIHVSSDYPVEVKKDGKSYRVATLFDVDCADLNLKSWHPVSYSPIVTHLINSRPNCSTSVCDISFRTELDQEIPMNESKDDLVTVEGQKISELLNLDDWLSSSGCNELQYSSDTGFNNVVICTDRRSYELRISNTDFTLLVENKKHFRLHKETRILTLHSEGTAIPQIIFPLNPSGSAEYRSQIIVYASLLAGKLIQTTNETELCLSPLEYHVRLSAAITASCGSIQELRRIAHGRDLYEMLGVSPVTSGQVISQRIAELKYLISSMGPVLGNRNPNLLTANLLDRLESAAGAVEFQDT